MMGPHCVWLVIVGGTLSSDGTPVTDPNITMLIELGTYFITHTSHIKFM